MPLAEGSTVKASRKNAEKFHDARPTARQLFLKHGIDQDPLASPPARPNEGSHGSLARAHGSPGPAIRQSASQLPTRGFTPDKGFTPAREQQAALVQQHVDPSGSQRSRQPLLALTPEPASRSSSKAQSLRVALGLSKPSSARQKQGNLRAMGFVSKKPSTMRQPVLQSPDLRKRSPVSRAGGGGIHAGSMKGRKRSKQSQRSVINLSTDEDDDGGDGLMKGTAKVFLSRGAGRDTSGNLGAASSLLGSFYGPASGQI